jgi:hypothetical protein
MPQKKWATDEQEEFLTSYWSEYQACTAAKKYQDFWKTVNIKFFECWLECKIIFADLPDDQVLMQSQTDALADAIAK